jgi:mono/diheme cytochrome c family protein
MKANDSTRPTLPFSSSFQKFFPAHSLPNTDCHIFHALRGKSDDCFKNKVAHPVATACKGFQNSGRNGVSYFLTRGWGSSTEGPSQITPEAERELRDEGISILKSRMIIITVLSLATLYSGGKATMPAQSKPAATPSGPEKLSDDARRGEGLFLQRCSLCHLPRKLKFGSPPVIGPSLSGQFKDATPDQMKVLRGFILKGGPDMPGFQYGLEPKEVDDLIAYLKTL